MALAASSCVTHPWLVSALLLVILPLAFFVLYTTWVCVRFLPTMVRVFEETPIFQPPDDPPIPGAEDVRFQTADGLWLQGSWLGARGGVQRGAIVFCHEYLSNRWSCRPYCEPLRDAGFDIFTFDFRNHGASERLDRYRPMQWVSNHEVLDVRAALAHVRSRLCAAETSPQRERGPGDCAIADTNPKNERGAVEPIGLLGVSRGGSAAILAAAVEPWVRAVATDGAFPTHAMHLAFMMRWAGIYVGSEWLVQITPTWYFALLCAIPRAIGVRRHGCRFPKVETAIRRLAPRPLLMMHGEKDSYVAAEIAQQLFDLAREPKQFWIVPGAKHNAAVQVAGESYTRRLIEFFSAELP
jgi:pimeloyl-ACP methyl ester carboxylesterase